jgi:WD40 repeat protein
METTAPTVAPDVLILNTIGATSYHFELMLARVILTALLLTFGISTSAQTPTFVPQSGHSKSVEGLAFNRSGTLLASAGSDGRFVLWDVSSGMMLTSFNVPLSSTRRVIGFTSDDQLAFIFGGMHAYAFEVSSGALKWERTEGALLAAASARANRAAYFPPSDVGKSMTLKIVDTSSGRDIGTVTTVLTNPGAIAFSPDGRLIAVGSGNGGSSDAAPLEHHLIVYDAETGAVKCTLRTKSARCSAVAFSNSGDLVAGVSYDKVGTAMNEYDNVTLQVWELPAGSERFHVKLPYKLSLAQCVSFDDEGNHLAVGIGGNDVPRQGELVVVNGAGVVSRVPSPIGPIWAVAYDKLHGVWAGSGGAAVIQLWDGQTNAAVARFASNTAAIESAHLNGAGDKLVLSTDRGETLVLDLTLGNTKPLPLRRAVTSGDSMVVAGIEDTFDHTDVYSLQEGKQLLRTDSVAGDLNTVALDKKGRYLIESLDAPNGNSSRLKVWDTSNKEKVLTIERPARTRRLQVLPSGDVLVVEDADGLALWRLSTREKIAEIKEPADSASLWIDKFTDSLTRVVSRADGNDMKVSLISVTVGDKVSITRPDALPEFVEAVGPGHTLVVTSGFAEAFYDWQSRRCTTLDYVLLDSDSNVFKTVYTAGKYTMVNTATNELYAGSLRQLKLPPIENRTFTPDGKHYVVFTLSGDILMWSVETGRFERLIKGNGASITSWSFSDDGRLFAAATPLGEAPLWNLQSGELAATFVCLGEGDWIARDRDKQHFMGTKTAEIKVAYRIGDQAVPFEQFDLLYNRPDIVLKHIGVASADRIEAARQAFIARAQRMQFVEQTESDGASQQTALPELDLDTASIPVSTESPQISISVKAAATQSSLARFNVYDNDVPVFGRTGVTLSGKTAATDVNIPLTVGSNFIELSVTDTDRHESIRRDVRVVRIDPTGKKPTLFIVTVGVSNYRDKNMALRYAAKDATDVAATFSGLSAFAKIEPLVLTDSQVSGNFLDHIREFLSQAAVDDEVVVFFSGHGFKEASGQYHFVPYDFDRADRSRGITNQDIEDLLDHVAARRKLVFIDTCFAGDDESETAGEAPADLTEKWRAYSLCDELVDLRRGSGAAVIAASGAYNPSYDQLKDKDINQGIFAYALIQALRNLKTATVSELREAVNSEVEKLSDGLQQPVVRNESLRFDFRVK